MSCALILHLSAAWQPSVESLIAITCSQADATATAGEAVLNSLFNEDSCLGRVSLRLSFLLHNFSVC